MVLTFGEKLKNLREDKDLTQTQLGSAIGMTQRKISYLENNQGEPSLQDIAAICKFFKVSADYMLGIANK